MLRAKPIRRVRPILRCDLVTTCELGGMGKSSSPGNYSSSPSAGNATAVEIAMAAVLPITG